MKQKKCQKMPTKFICQLCTFHAVKKVIMKPSFNDCKTQNETNENKFYPKKCLT